MRSKRVLLRISTCSEAREKLNGKGYAHHADKNKVEKEAIVRAIIFDCDGVLADTERDGHRVAFNKAFAKIKNGSALGVSVNAIVGHSIQLM